MTDFNSQFAIHMENMIAYRVALGYCAKTYTSRLQKLDRFIEEKYPYAICLTKEMVTDWLTPEGNESISHRQSRARIARQFAEYLLSVNCDAYVVPKRYICGKTSFCPYLLTDKELSELFDACDSLPNTPKDALYQATASVMLRLLYTCGLRPGEGLRLQTRHICFDTGEILITNTKLKKDRMVVASDSMLVLLKKYLLQKQLHGRAEHKYFFSRPDGTAYTHDWLQHIMKKSFRKANSSREESELPRVRAYDLRHRFASAILCKWLEEGENIYNMLPYLRTYMGHSSLSQTAYYIHILPENLMCSAGVDWDRLDAVIPEAAE